MTAKSLSLIKTKAESVVFIFAFSLALALAAQAKIPLIFSPVPLTLQTFVVYLAVKILKKKAVFSVILYLAAGVLGLPVFAGNSLGISYLAGPTGGYILGFLVTCLVIPFVFANFKTFAKNLISFLSAAAIIYSFGLIWLVSIYKLTLQAALVAGLYPFVIGEAIKITSAAFLTRKTSNVEHRTQNIERRT
ncbi:MAG: biotin transporter BioY [Candidatus Omnitrophica bacterium]|nr:biotin transporter BioY [Candidatus Omnitrophota bacterium]MCF7895049.1 biotin transporter BioY [Candidatus Omnitrophota bacterium]